MANVKLITGPTDDEVLLSTVKARLDVPHDEHDVMLQEMISGAVEFVQEMTGRVLLDSTWTWYLDRFTSARPNSDEFWFSPTPIAVPGTVGLQLPIAPISAVDSVKYIDGDGVLQTLASSDWAADIITEPGRLYPSKTAVTWPSIGDYPNAVQVTLSAGYADTDAIPARLRLGVMSLIGHYYENREAYIDSPFDLRTVPDGLRSVIHQYRLSWFV